MQRFAQGTAQVKSSGKLSAVCFASRFSGRQVLRKIRAASLLLSVLLFPAAPGAAQEWLLRLHAARAAAVMPDWQKASQVLMTGIDGNTSFSPYLYRHFDGVVPGAVLLFGYNIGDTAEQVRAFLADCASAFRNIGTPAPVVFAIDHEGGDVYRTGRLTTRLPSARTVASTMTVREAEDLYAQAGKELFSLGIRLNLAPVAECPPEDASFLGSRVFSPDPGKTAAYAAAAVRGFQSAGVLCAVKHFPGNAGNDPHASVAVVDVPPAECRERYFAPFYAVLRGQPAAVLVSHTVFSAVDNVPFCLSAKGVTGILKGEMGFSGLVLTDDISMEALAAAGWPETKAAVAAIAAGCDMILTSSTEIRAITGALCARAAEDPVFRIRLEEAAANVLFFKQRAALLSYGAETHVR